MSTTTYDPLAVKQKALAEAAVKAERITFWKWLKYRWDRLFFRRSIRIDGKFNATAYLPQGGDAESFNQGFNLAIVLEGIVKVSMKSCMVFAVPLDQTLWPAICQMLTDLDVYGVATTRSGTWYLFVWHPKIPYYYAQTIWDRELLAQDTTADSSQL